MDEKLKAKTCKEEQFSEWGWGGGIRGMTENFLHLRRPSIPLTKIRRTILGQGNKVSKTAYQS